MYPQAYLDIDKASKAINESNDCVVKAIAILAKIPYQQAHDLSVTHGRKYRRRAWFANVGYMAFKELGYEMVTHHKQSAYYQDILSQYPNGHRPQNITFKHPKRFPDVWQIQKDMILQTGGHVGAIIDGHLIDWSAGRSFRVQSFYTLEKI